MNTYGLSVEQAKFLTLVYSTAKKLETITHVPAEVVAAQAALESNWGKQSIGNNLFGIKAGSSWSGKVQEVKTHEFEQGGNKLRIAKFRDYDSPEDSISDHAAFLTLNQRYRWAFSTPYFFRNQEKLEEVLTKFPSADDKRRFSEVQAIARDMTWNGHAVPYCVHFAQRIHEAGYATSPTYSRELIKIMKARLI